jgi:hypothetical protein
LEHESSSSIDYVVWVEAVRVVSQLFDDRRISVHINARLRRYGNVRKILKSLVKLTDDVICGLGGRVCKDEIVRVWDDWCSPGQSVCPVDGLTNVVISPGDAGAEESESDETHNVKEEWADEAGPSVNTVGVFVGHKVRYG